MAQIPVVAPQETFIGTHEQCYVIAAHVHLRTYQSPPLNTVGGPSATVPPGVTANQREGWQITKSTPSSCKPYLATLWSRTEVLTPVRSAKPCTLTRISCATAPTIAVGANPQIQGQGWASLIVGAAPEIYHYRHSNKLAVSPTDKAPLCRGQSTPDSMAENVFRSHLVVDTHSTLTSSCKVLRYASAVATRLYADYSPCLNAGGGPQRYKGPTVSGRMHAASNIH